MLTKVPQNFKLRGKKNLLIWSFFSQLGTLTLRGEGVCACGGEYNGSLKSLDIKMKDFRLLKDSQSGFYNSNTRNFTHNQLVEYTS